MGKRNLHDRKEEDSIEKQEASISECPTEAPINYLLKKLILLRGLRLEEVDLDGEGQACCDGEQVEELAEDKEVELAKVALAYAVVDPGAVMVETIDAAQAEVAVATPWGSDETAVGAEAGRTHRVQQRHEVHLAVSLQIARIAASDHCAKEHAKAKKHLDGND